MGMSRERQRYTDAVKKTGAIVRQTRYLFHVSLWRGAESLRETTYMTKELNTKGFPLKATLPT
jgi:hypothetical protein